MPENTKAAQAPKEGEVKPADPAKPPVLIIDTTDQHPPGWGVSM